MQSLRDDELKRLSRLHGADRARRAFGEAREAGFDNISLDLMMWLPGQRVDDWLESVDGVLALDPEHLSLYLLEVYPNAPLKEDMARARWSQAPDDDAALMYLSAMDRLDAHGYEQYEISNVAKPGRASRHNLKYWSGWRVARLWMRRALDRGRRPVEECLGHRGLHRRGATVTGPPLSTDDSCLPGSGSGMRSSRGSGWSKVWTKGRSAPATASMSGIGSGRN